MRRGLLNIAGCLRNTGWLLISLLTTAAPVAAQIDFNRDVRPILSDKCFHCHGPDQATREADLRLDDEASARENRDGTIVVKAGDVANSALIARITANDPDVVMPPPHTNKPLTEAEIQILQQWIQQGAEWATHWAYVPPVRYPTPQVAAHDWPQNWVDNFLLANLEARQISPSEEADKATLLRRLSFDLTGLPPDQTLAQSFLNDSSPQAWDNLVDQLLASPHFGERMAIYWLDLVRYADTVGYHGDQDHNISPYRDWVIQAFNENLPFDDFTRQQLAGDLLPDATADQIVATGYNRLLQTTHEGGLQAKEYRSIYAADRVRNVSAVWMGATVGCAQCHDHKFDPYTARDFYSLAAFFADVDDESHFTNGTNALPARRDPEMEFPTPQQTQQIATLEAQIEDYRQQASSKDATLAIQQESAEKLKAAEAELKKIRSQVRRSMITVALPEPRVVRVQPRGNWMDESGEIVQPAIPEFLGAIDAGGRPPSRLDLANWFVDSQNGAGLLTARVMVNRLWYLCFGSGLASDLQDFGGQGHPPEHPELLDRLAHEFVDSGWNVKALFKRIVTSSAYRQSSRIRPDLQTIDPINRWHARQSTWRLPAEMVRDNALAVSGLLVSEIGGASVRPYQPAGYFRHLNFPTRTWQAHTDSRQWRRGIYVHWQRQFLHPMLKAFDAPSREECTAQRPRSNTPLAALALLNDPTFVEAARVFASHALATEQPSDTDRIEWIIQQAVTRPALQQEVALLKKLLDASRRSIHSDQAQALASAGLTKLDSGTDVVEVAAWTEVCRAVLNMAETSTRE